MAEHRQPRGLVHEDRRGGDRPGWEAAAGEKERRRLPPQPRQGPRQGPDARPLQADPRSRRSSCASSANPPLIVPIDELVDEDADIEAAVLKIIADYRDTLPEDRRVLLDGYRFVDAALQGGRRRQRRHPRLRRADAGTRRAATRSSSRSRKPRLGARALRGTSAFDNQGERVVAGPAPDPGRQRHPARLGQSEGHRRRAARLLRAPALGPEGLGQGREHDRQRPSTAYAQICGTTSGPRPRPSAATASRSPPTSARATPSTRRSPTSPRPTPTRTSATTPSSAGGCRRRRDRSGAGDLSAALAGADKEA